MTDVKKAPGDPGWFEGGEGAMLGAGLDVQAPDLLLEPEPAPVVPLPMEPEDEEPAQELKGNADGRLKLHMPEAKSANAAPAWFPRDKIPQGLRFPRNMVVVFIAVPADQTAARHKGDRYLILWEVNEADEKLAAGRGMGDQGRTLTELTKQMIRGFDGQVAGWAGPGTPDSVDDLWRELGAKGRNLMRILFSQINTFDETALKDFFEQRIACVVTG